MTGAAGPGASPERDAQTRREVDRVFCLALDSQAGDALRQVFGHGNYRTVLRPAALSRALTQLHEQLDRR